MNQAELTKSETLSERERARLYEWPRIGICLERVMAAQGRMEDIARTLREDEKYAPSYTIEEQIQYASDRLRASIRAFEKAHKVKIEIFTFFSPFDDHTETFIESLQRPEEVD